MKILNKDKSIETLKLNDDGTARVTIIAVPIRNQEVGYSKGDSYGTMNITEAFADKLMLSFNKRRRTAFGLGKPKNIPLLWEHQQDIGNILGTVYSDIVKETIVIDGVPTKCLLTDVLITDQDIVKDIIENGRGTDSSVSIGADVSNPDNPVLQEISLVKTPALKDAVLLSGEEQKFHNLNEDKKKEIIQLSEELQELKMGILGREYQIKELERKEEIQTELNLILNHAFGQNQINKIQLNKYKQIKFNSLEEVKNIEAVLKSLPKNILNLSSRFNSTKV